MKRRIPSPAPALALLSLLALLPPAAGAQVGLFTPNDRVSVYTEPTLNTGVCDLQLSCPVRGAELYVDKDYVGILPDAGTFAMSVAPGIHYLEIVSPGYYDLGVWFAFEEKTLYYLDFKPQRITGYVSIRVEPSDASVFVDGSRGGQGLTELPTGRHRLTIRHFGFIERSLDVEVAEKATSTVDLSLDKAPFTVSKLAFNRAVFNPGNAGAAGKSSLAFQASNYGSATAEIRGPGGNLAARLGFPSIDTWNQSQTWDGLGVDGTSLPDGLYTVLLVAVAAPGIQAEAGEGQELAGDGSIHARTELRIDSSLVIRPYGTASALAGLIHMPDTLLAPEGILSAEAFWFAPWGEPQASAIGLSAARSFGDLVTICADAAAETGGSPAGGFDAGLSALLPFFGDRGRAASGALFIKGSYSSVSSPSLPEGGSAAEASLPLSLRIGGLSLALSPGALVELGSSPLTWLGLARAALSLEGRSYRIGASGELPFSFLGALPSPLWPARAALEARLMIGSSPFVAAAYLEGELEPGAAPRLALGIGLGLLF